MAAGALIDPTAFDLADVKKDLRDVRSAMKAAGLPPKLLDSVQTRAERSARRKTGQHQSNRASRWKLNANDPQYGTELDCKLIHLRLLAMMLEFTNAPAVPDAVIQTLEQYLGRPIQLASYEDDLTKEVLDYNAMLAEVENPVAGHSNFHIGHIHAQASPKHTVNNVSWRTKRSNLIQGDLTLAQARLWVVEVVARYFGLGEVTQAQP